MKEYTMRKSIAPYRVLLLLITFLLTPSVAMAQADGGQQAKALMASQLEALKAGNYQQFVANGNKAFSQMMDERAFDSLKMRKGPKLGQGFALEYLGMIQRLGMQEFLWKVKIIGDKNEMLGSLSLSNGKVVGFALD